MTPAIVMCARARASSAHANMEVACLRALPNTPPLPPPTQVASEAEGAAEPLAQFWERAGGVWHSAATAAHAPGGRTIALVAHSAIVSAMLCRCLGLGPERLSLFRSAPGRSAPPLATACARTRLLKHAQARRALALACLSSGLRPFTLGLRPVTDAPAASCFSGAKRGRRARQRDGDRVSGRGGGGRRGRHRRARGRGAERRRRALRQLHRAPGCAPAGGPRLPRAACTAPPALHWACTAPGLHPDRARAAPPALHPLVVHRICLGLPALPAPRQLRGRAGDRHDTAGGSVLRFVPQAAVMPSQLVGPVWQSVLPGHMQRSACGTFEYTDRWLLGRAMGGPHHRRGRGLRCMRPRWLLLTRWKRCMGLRLTAMHAYYGWRAAFYIIRLQQLLCSVAHERSMLLAGLQVSLLQRRCGGDIHVGRLFWLLWG